MKTIARLPLAQLQANDAHVGAFKALAHLSRLQVFFFLVRAQGEVSAGAIQEALGVPGPTLSHHLDQLRRAGLIESRKEERYICCSIQDVPLQITVRPAAAAELGAGRRTRRANIRS